MKHHPMQLSSNTRALVVGASLLVMAAAAAELRQQHSSESMLHQAAEVAASSKQNNSIAVEQILVGLALLQMGYSEHELTQWFVKLESKSHTALLTRSHAKLHPATGQHTIDLSQPLYQADLRQGLALVMPSLPSGSPPRSL
jgi:hypothetical protein